MNYAQYVSRRPPSPPSPHHRHRPFAPSASLSSAASTVSSETPFSPSSRPPFHTPEAVSSQLHRRAVRDEYSSLAAVVLANVQLDDQRERHEIIRIRLEDMIATSQASNHRVLTLALSKCTARLDRLAQQSHHLEHARSRMRVIEAKHFHGADAPSVQPRLRALHLRREHIATLVDQIQCTLHDQERIQYLLTTLAEKLSALYTLVSQMDRNAKPNSSDTSDRPAAYVPSRSKSPRVSSFTHETSRRTSTARRVSINPFGHSAAEHSKSSPNAWIRTDRTPTRADRSNTRSDRQTNRGRILPTQRQQSLPQRSGEQRRIPFVVKRALSYNASSVQNTLPMTSEPSGINRSSSVHERIAAQSEPRLRVSDTFKRRRNVSASTKSSGSFGAGDVDALSEAHMTRMGGGDHRFGECDRLSGSPVSPHMKLLGENSLEDQMTQQRRNSQLEQSVLLDIDCLCTEASSVLSSSRSVHQEAFEKRSSTSLFGNEGKRGMGLGKLGFHRVRIWSQIRKLWGDINDMYGVVITHGPHLVEEKIVSAASVDKGLLGEWISARKGRTSGMKGRVHKTIVAEAVRKVDDVVAWQQKLIVAIRRDSTEQRKTLRQADMVISEAYLQSLRARPMSK
ncbi:unnamed protein product [Agarophyton chilense]|eukprot:gb/GEZJ01004987.1/.p1 GENE.gb/GEZJ01004987.1/~~gb/GEZJ01004987.1/.p1  ORF type:complete len:623 (-),score=70.69 gb/GEZJ01004987.1/:794-2662(-)